MKSKNRRVSQNITKPWFEMLRKTTYKKLQIYTEWLRFGYDIETFLKCRLWYYYHGSNEQRVIEKIWLLFFIVKELTCAIIKQINKSEFVERFPCSLPGFLRFRPDGNFIIHSVCYHFRADLECFSCGLELHSGTCNTSNQ